MNRLLFTAAAAAALVAAASFAMAQEMIGSVVRGHELALDVCAECHWASEEQFVIPESEAPSFFQLAENPAYSPIGLRVALRTPHFNMPDLMLTSEQTDDVIAYILWLRAQQR